jgi:peptidoglycan/LPS O-acetylase OafA/YrhL
VDNTELFRVQEGLSQWNGEAIAGLPSAAREETGISVPPSLVQNQDYDPNHSPLWYLVASAPLLSWGGSFHANTLQYWGWLARIPYVLFGVLLGASLWYVSRRLYGNAGGYIALGLYCFSPGIIRSSSVWFVQPEMSAAWGAFGAIFTAIAVAHTLYAPREVILWNWRRIVLLGLSLAMAIGSQFSLIVIVPLGLGFMLYLAPMRIRAAFAICGAACLVALALLYASYFFHLGAFWNDLRHADFFSISWRALLMPRAYLRVLQELAQSSPAFWLMLLAALVCYAAWPRTRYFGNTAPLLVAFLFLLLGAGSPHYPGLGFLLMAIPFLYVFVAGIAADLLESKQGSFAEAAVWGLLIANALWNVAVLARVGRS